MKKLMIAACAVAMATVAQAVAVDWAASKIFTGDGSYDQASGYACYLFVDQTMSATTLATELAAADFSNLVATKYEATASAATVLEGTSYSSSLANGTYDAYMVVFDASAPDSASRFFMTEVGDYDLVISGSADMIDFGVVYNYDPSTWQSIATASPEPTSGLLLLIGVAGLALRRRRA